MSSALWKFCAFLFPSVFSHSNGLIIYFTLLTFWIMVLDFFSLLVNNDISVVCEVDIIHLVMRIKKSTKYLILAPVSTLLSLILYLYGLHSWSPYHPLSTTSMVFFVPFVVQARNSKASSPVYVQWLSLMPVCCNFFKLLLTLSSCFILLFCVIAFILHSSWNPV